MTIDEVIIKVFEEIKKLPEGTETSISQIISSLYPDTEFSTNDLFEVNREVMKKVKEENIILDSGTDGVLYVGLPFNITFIKREK